MFIEYDYNKWKRFKKRTRFPAVSKADKIVYHTTDTVEREEMGNLRRYLNKRGITEEQMQEARLHTQAAIDAHNGVPIAQMTLVNIPSEKSRIGAAKGQIEIPDDFDNWDSDIEDMFESAL